MLPPGLLGGRGLTTRVRHTASPRTGGSTGSLVNALANEKTPLRDTAPTAPERAQKTADRSTVARRRVVVGIIVALVVIGGLWFLFGRGKDSIISNPFTSSAPPVPTFHFSTVVPKYEALQAQLGKSKLEKTAKQTAPAIEKATTEFLQSGYVSPDGWGDSGSIDGYFTDDAKAQVDPNVDTLTLGKSAQDQFDTFTPAKKGNTVRVTALVDGNLNAVQAAAEFTFKGTAANSDGTSSKVTVTGTLFFVPDGNDWKIQSFHVNRVEQPHKASSASASASEATS
jgi:hypothetical protein